MKKADLPRLVSCLITLLLTCTGCAGYRLGSMLPKELSSVHVPVFKNNTAEPFIETVLTNAVRDEIQKDASLSLENEAEADTELLITINSYTLLPLAYDRENRTQASEYRVLLETSVVLRNRRTGEVVVSYPRVRGDATFDFSGDLTNAKRQALPAVADDLAHQIVERVVEAW
jgi:Lipopolysaccharide-assembly